MCLYREEDLEAKEVREAWRVEQSAIWRPRLREADSRGFWDTAACRDRMFEADWARACGKEKFATMMARENKNSKVSCFLIEMRNCELLQGVWCILEWLGAQ